MSREFESSETLGNGFLITVAVATASNIVSLTYSSKDEKFRLSFVFKLIKPIKLANE